MMGVILPKQRKYIDVNSGIGRMNYREERIPYTVEALVNEMIYYRVHASLVYSNVSSVLSDS